MIEQHIYDLLPNTFKKVIGDLPGTYYNSVSIVLFDGAGNDEYFGSNTVYRPVVKIIVRNESYAVAQQWVADIKQALDKHQDDYFLSIFLQGFPLYLGKSEQKLHEFQIVFNIQVKE